jgi:hypothetical protein
MGGGAKMSFFSGSMTNSEGSQGEWLTLVDYSHRTGVSLSTLRRYIKAEKIPFRLEQGKYLVQAPASSPVQPQKQTQTQPRASISASSVVPSGLTHTDSHLRMRVQELESALRRAHEEIAELKMLVALYEQTSPAGEGDSWSAGQA